jgi:UDP-N-acetylmuramoyl-tripeptide--D-alanyl-D-alanine ligase
VGDFQIPLSFLNPSVVALLNVGTAHVGEFGSLENLRREKLSILQASTARLLAVCGDDDLLLKAARRSGRRFLCFGAGAHNDVRILDEDGERVRLSIQGEDGVFLCPWTASAKSLNIAAAVTLSLHLGVPLSFVRKGIETFGGVARRFQSFEWEGVTAIDDAFNASPESLIAGLRSLHRIAARKKTLLIIGSLLELGNLSETLHRDLARTLADIWGDFHQAPLALATVGDAARPLGEHAVELGLAKDRYIHFADAMTARNTLRSWKNSFDLVYFKGSKGVQLHRIFEAVER